MLRVETVGTPDRAEWDARCASVDDGNIYQTTVYAEVCRRVDRQKTEFLVARDGASVVGQLLVLRGNPALGVLAEQPLWRLLFPIAKLLDSEKSFAHGPLVFDRSRYDEVLDAFAAHLATDASFAYSNALPPMHAPWIDHERVKHIFVKHGFQAKPHGTFLVDLTKSKDELWNALDKKARYGVRRTLAQGAEAVEVKTRDDMKLFYQTYLDMFRRNGLHPYSFESFSRGYEVYGDLTKKILILHKGNPVSAISLVCFNGICFQYNVSYSDYAAENSIYGNDLIEWRAIEVLKESGNRIYDLAGVNPAPQTEKERGLYHFKSKWGGAFVNAYSYSKTSPTLKQKGLRSLKRSHRAVFGKKK